MRNITDLTQDELKALFLGNGWLKDKVSDMMLDDAYSWIGDYLHSFERISGVEYSVSCYHDYFSVEFEAYPQFLEATKEMQKDFCLLSDKTLERLNRLAEKVDYLMDCNYGYEDISDSRWQNLERWAKDIVEDITSEILKQCQDEIYACYDEDNQLDYFLNFTDYFADYITDDDYIYETVCHA